MQFNGGDYIALGMFGLTIISFALRERRSRGDRIALRSANEANAKSLTDLLKNELAVLTAAVKDLEEKRQKHDIECAKIQERTAGTLDRVTERLDHNERNLANLNAQMAHMASGGANTFQELPPVARRRKKL